MAESFGVDADRYDRTRPRYPAALIARIAAAGPDVLDVGSGTGIVARQLQAAGCRVLGVEPDARMAAFGRRHGVAAEEATFEEWDPADRTFDALVAGQAWHWVDPVAGAAKAARVLRPGGRLVVFWNAFELPPELAAAFGAVYERVLPGSPISLAARDAYPTLAAMAADGMRDELGAPQEWLSRGRAPTRATSGWPRCRRSAATACSPRRNGTPCWPGSGRRSTRSAAVSRWATRRWPWPRCVAETATAGSS